MPDPFSVETQNLLDRAQRAIDEAVRLRHLIRDQIEEAERRTFQFGSDVLPRPSPALSG